MSDEGRIWRTIGGRRVFIRDGEDLETAMKNSGKFNDKKTTKQVNNRKNLVNYFKEQSNIDLEKAATEEQFAPRTGLNIDSRKLSQNEFNEVRRISREKKIIIQENGAYDYFIRYNK